MGEVFNRYTDTAGNEHWSDTETGHHVIPKNKYEYHYDHMDCIEAMPSAQPEQHWIPVTERLPEYGAAVLTINEDDDYEINHIIDEEDGEWFFHGAIAWMPLPDPYKGEENETD